MGSYKHICLVEGLVDAVAAVFCDKALESLEDVGVFYDGMPDAEDCTIATAIRNGERAFGIASWALSPLYVEGKMRLGADKTDIAAATAILVASPDYSTAWNVRKSALVPEMVGNELLFNALMLHRSPKSAESWAHRAWVIREFGCKQQQLQNELDLAWMTSSRAASNYYAGVHRLRIIEKLPSSTLLVELQQSRKWLRTHISDSSGWWYQRLLFARGKSLAIVHLDEEVDYCSKLMAQYGPSQQCIRIHEKWLGSMPGK